MASDIIIVAVYLLIIAYVIYQAINSLEDRTTVLLDQAGLTAELERTGLSDVLKIDFGFKSSDRFTYDKQINSLTITVTNGADTSMQVDWEESTLIDVGGQSHRVVRVTPDRRMSLWVYQAPSTIGPGAAMKTQVTSEDSVTLSGDGAIADIKPLIDAKTLSKSKTDILTMALWLRVRVLSSSEIAGSDRPYLLCCKIQVIKLPWTDYLPISLGS
ncbi:hypothetical protein [Leptolyngbya sp. CCY15150]|uniref:hypothetical protein n=1 Tax=Leptolyngbya sp. CCY15150 TaxID=2767772 RepID=UPI00194DF965|nr:hypothetical protein [Leptolyngbya sp. CCY15150]